MNKDIRPEEARYILRSCLESKAKIGLETIPLLTSSTSVKDSDVTVTPQVRGEPEQLKSKVLIIPNSGSLLA